MSRNGHSGRCFRDYRRTRTRLSRQGRVQEHRKFASILAAMLPDIFGNWQAAARFSLDKLQSMLRLRTPTPQPGGKVNKSEKRVSAAIRKAATEGAFKTPVVP